MLCITKMTKKQKVSLNSNHLLLDLLNFECVERLGARQELVADVYIGDGRIDKLVPSQPVFYFGLLGDNPFLSPLLQLGL